MRDSKYYRVSHDLLVSSHNSSSHDLFIASHRFLVRSHNLLVSSDWISIQLDQNILGNGEIWEITKHLWEPNNKSLETLYISK